MLANMGRLENIRNDYRKGALEMGMMDDDPVVQFGKWMQDVIDAGVEEPTAMALATSTTDGFPSARMVLLKGFDDRGFVFFTNYLSRKGLEMDLNPQAALVFYWKELERQVRIEGDVVRISEDESDEYFRLRPRESQAGAVVSPQSQVIATREELDQAMQELLEDPAEIARPEYWGGFLVRPAVIEFWQGRPGRLHDRFRYSLKDSYWILERLAP
jgi:pyridoxamine 5'-phosphate oxidase